MTKQKQSERDEFISKLRETLKPGDTVHTILRSVSRSGMQRKLDVYRFRKDAVDEGQPERALQCSRGHEFYGRNGDTTGWDNDGGYALNQERL